MAWLHSVFFIDHNRGWAVGSKGTLLRTDDGGRNWKTTAASTDDVVRDIFFVDEQNGWLVCEVNIYQLKTNDDPRAYLMKTTDGGNK
ncbi:MAG TPA: YCF48-related protein, partial [Pyrinomonadaceae bacterium]|nr:YCF48-related protein [Pyrinomonadaceae bacterium]